MVGDGRVLGKGINIRKRKEDIFIDKNKNYNIRGN